MEDFLRMFFRAEFIVLPMIVGIVAFVGMYLYLRRERNHLLVGLGIRASNWIMVGGSQSNRYYDIDKACSSLEGTDTVNNWYMDNLRELNDKFGVDSLAFIERDDGPVGAVTKKDKISSELRIPSFIVRPRRRIKASVLKGTSASLIRDKTVVVVSDVTTTGRSIERVVRILEGFGARVVAVVTVVNREPKEIAARFRGKNIEFRYAEDRLNSYIPSDGNR